MREFLGGIEGASSHASDWLDPIIAALASEGAHNVHDLAGAKFEDFDFSASSMNGAAKRLVRQAIALATAGQAAPPEPSGRGGEPSNGNAAAASAASAATAAIAEFLQKKKRRGIEADVCAAHLRPCQATAHVDLLPALQKMGLAGLPQDQRPRCQHVHARASQPRPCGARAQLRADRPVAG